VFDIDETASLLTNAIGEVMRDDREGVLRKTLKTLIGKDNADRLCSNQSAALPVFRSLSAGQRLVTAIITDIVGFIEEGSLLLIDEPETHLHPGLLSSIIVATQTLLEAFDSYAIISTHSPVMLQQVPRRYVRVFTRVQDRPAIETLNRESFGEDLGELARSVFGLAEPERDYTYYLERLYKKLKDPEKVDALFDGTLGLPAKAFLYSIHDRQQD
jgi:predicted ATP-dependent endonuclease of OLD family